MGGTVNAERASVDEMDLVCENWLTNVISKNGNWAGSSHATIASVDEIVDGDLVLAHCYHITPQGYVVVPVLKELPPIKVSSDECNLDVTKTEGMALLIKEYLQNRIESYIKTYGSLDAVVPSNEEILFKAAHRSQWNYYAVSNMEFKASLTKDIVEQVGPLMTVSWHQREPFYNYCPIGYEGNRTLVGCVATAAAQIMKYYEWPPFGYSDHTYYWGGDNSCEGGSTPGEWLSADFFDSFTWSDMPDDCFGTCNPEQSIALAELNYEVGVAFEMDYGVCGSGVFTSDIPFCMNQFETKFRYLDQMQQRFREGLSAATWFDWIKDEINDSLPIWYFITSHSIVCDGWRIFDDSLKQYHMNYGWDDGHNAWYTLDNYHCPDPEGCYQSHESMVIGIKPNKGVMFTEDTTVGWVPFDVSFTGSSVYTVNTWQWDFGDSGTDDIPAPVHTYEDQGLYDVTLVIDTGGDTLSIQRPQHIIALADSLVGSDISGSKGAAVEMIIYERNTVPTGEFIIPFDVNGSLNIKYDSFSTEGCRTDYFEKKEKIHSDTWVKQYTIQLLNSTSGTSPELEPGDGPVIKLYFTIPGAASSGQEDTVELNGYGIYLPSFSGSMLDYAPITFDGVVSYNCCNLRGDVDHSGGIDVADLTYLVARLFLGGPPPPCEDEGDVDGSGGIDVADLTYLVARLFLGGPPPPPC